MANDIFITGASGFLGRRLLAELLRAADGRFHVLVRSARAQSLIADQLRSIDLDRIAFVRGDVTMPGLGLGHDSVYHLSQTVGEVWHLAASTAFEESKRDETFRANAAGTAALLELAKRFTRLRSFYYMSTAYVCGMKLDSIPEGPFDLPGAFKNPYEESKYHSERLVYETGLPVVVLRPSITIGDSQTGENDGENRMLYGYAYALLRAAMHAFQSSKAYWDYWRGKCAPPNSMIDVDARLLVQPDAFKNAVTVDDVISVCLAIRRSGEAAGQTFNMVNPSHIRCEQIVAAIQGALRVVGYRNDPLLTASKVKSGTLVERAAYRHTRLLWPYCMNTEPAWQTANVDRLPLDRVVMTEPLFGFMMREFIGRLSPHR